MKTNAMCKKIAAQEKRVEEYKNAVQQLKRFQGLRTSWQKLLKRGKLQPINYWRSLSFFAPKDEPVDASQIWNWMVENDCPETKAYHTAVGKMLDEAVKSWSAKVDELCR